MGYISPHTKKSKQSHREPFAVKLNEIFKQAEIAINDYAQLGVSIAKEQGDRRPIPYADYTIDGWLKGALLPTPVALSALCSVLEKKHKIFHTISEQLDDALDDALEAEQESKIQPTELTHALQTARLRAVLGYDDLTTITTTWNTKHPNSGVRLAKTMASMSYTLSGNRQNYPSKFFVYALEPHLLKHLDSPNSLRALHEMSLRERADALWNSAIDETPANLGRMIKAMRVRRGEEMNQFGKTLAATLKREEAFTNSTVLYWEDNTNIPPCYEQSNSCEALVTLMQVTDRAPNGLARSIDKPWFTEGMQRQFRVAFQQARQHRNAYVDGPAFHTTQPPSLAEINAMPPSAKVMHASLAGRVVSGHKKDWEK